MKGKVPETISVCVCDDEGEAGGFIPFEFPEIIRFLLGESICLSTNDRLLYTAVGFRRKL